MFFSKILKKAKKKIQQQSKKIQTKSQTESKLWHTYHSIHRLLLQVFHKDRVPYPLRKKVLKGDQV